jgi:hypothetical protein
LLVDFKATHEAELFRVESVRIPDFSGWFACAHHGLGEAVTP